MGSHHTPSTFTHVSKRKIPVTRVISDKFGMVPQYTKGDGHCVLHAFHQSWNNQIRSPAAPDLETIISSIFVECTAKREQYLPFTCLSSVNFTNQLHRYLLKKEYLTSFCDLVPLILANSFGIRIIVLNDVKGTLHTCEIAPSCSKFNATLYIFRSDDHYSALSVQTTSRTPITQVKHTDFKSYSVATSNKFSVLKDESSSFSGNDYDNNFPVSNFAVKQSKFSRKTQKKGVRKPYIAASDVLVVGTSHVRGVGAALNRIKVNALAYANPGCNIHHISRRIHNMVPKHFTGKVVLQVGGNDCGETDSETVIGRFEALVFLLRSHAPDCQLFVNEIPPRNKCSYSTFKIRTVNDFLHHLSLFEKNITYISHSHFADVQHFKKDGVHLNNTGFDLYIQTLANCLQDFPLPQFSTNGT